VLVDVAWVAKRLGIVLPAYVLTLFLSWGQGPPCPQNVLFLTGMMGKIHDVNSFNCDILSSEPYIIVS